MKSRTTSKQHSKRWVDRWQYFTMFWVSIFNVVDICFNQAEHLLELNVTLITSVIAVMIPFLCKAYFETKQEKMIALQQQEDKELQERDDEVLE